MLKEERILKRDIGSILQEIKLKLVEKSHNRERTLRGEEASSKGNGVMLWGVRREKKQSKSWWGKHWGQCIWISGWKNFWPNAQLPQSLDKYFPHWISSINHFLVVIFSSPDNILIHILLLENIKSTYLWLLQLAFNYNLPQIII